MQHFTTTPDVVAIARGGLAPRHDLPLFRQIYANIRDAILSGSLPPGSRLPSSRSLSSQIGIARGTVETAYDLLVAEGYAAGRGAAGTVVDPQFTRPPGPHPPQAPSQVVPLAESPDTISTFWPPRPFQPGVPAIDAFPLKLWSRLATRRARYLSTTSLGYQDATGHPPLRHAIASYLGIARGVACTPNQIVLTAGFQGALGLISHVLIQPGDSVWLEDPGYPLARQALTLAGARIVTVPVDPDGLDIAAARHLDPNASLAIVTPSHQMPLGMPLTLPRRLDLLAWATEHNAWIVEDDYDGEFRYSGRPLPALKSLDTNGRVIYAGTFSKVLFPGLRLGYLVIPSSLIDLFTRACQLLQPNHDHLTQHTVADFIDAGHFARHIRRMRALYAERRAALDRSLTTTFGSSLQLEPRPGGLHILATFPTAASDLDLARHAFAHNLAPTPLSAFAVQSSHPPALLLSFPNLPAAQSSVYVGQLHLALKDLLRS